MKSGWWWILEIAGWLALGLMGISLWRNDYPMATFNLVGLFYLDWLQKSIKP